LFAVRQAQLQMKEEKHTDRRQVPNAVAEQHQRISPKITGYEVLVRTEKYLKKGSDPVRNDKGS
jgi:hypothetical protein